MADTATKLTVKNEGKSVKGPETGWSPFEGLRSEIDRLFDDFTPMLWHRPFGRMSLGTPIQTVAAPAIDLVEKEKSYEITAEMPGIEPKDLDVRIANGVLTIRGEKQETKEETAKEYHVSERRYGAFQRSFRVPQSIDSTKIEASFVNGVLTLHLPKTAEAQQSERKITIKG
jgi:HSP20 family protein